MDIKDEASIINSDENVVSDVEQADLSINGDDSYTIYPNAEVYPNAEAERINNCPDFQRHDVWKSGSI